jgi:hypothetical protein
MTGDPSFRITHADRVEGLGFGLAIGMVWLWCVIVVPR